MGVVEAIHLAHVSLGGSLVAYIEIELMHSYRVAMEGNTSEGIWRVVDERNRIRRRRVPVMLITCKPLSARTIFASNQLTNKLHAPEPIVIHQRPQRIPNLRLLRRRKHRRRIRRVAILRLVLDGDRVEVDALALEALEALQEIRSVGSEVLGLERAAVHRAGGLHPAGRGPGDDVDLEVAVDGLNVAEDGEEVGGRAVDVEVGEAEWGSVEGIRMKMIGLRCIAIHVVEAVDCMNHELASVVCFR